MFRNPSPRTTNSRSSRFQSTRPYFRGGVESKGHTGHFRQLIELRNPRYKYFTSIISDKKFPEDSPNLLYYVLLENRGGDRGNLLRNIYIRREDQ